MRASKFVLTDPLWVGSSKFLQKKIHQGDTNKVHYMPNEACSAGTLNISLFDGHSENARRKLWKCSRWVEHRHLSICSQTKSYLWKLRQICPWICSYDWLSTIYFIASVNKWREIAISRWENLVCSLFTMVPSATLEISSRERADAFLIPRAEHGFKVRHRSSSSSCATTSGNANA